MNNGAKLALTFFILAALVLLGTVRRRQAPQSPWLANPAGQSAGVTLLGPPSAPPELVWHFYLYGLPTLQNYPGLALTSGQKKKIMEILDPLREADREVQAIGDKLVLLLTPAQRDYLDRRDSRPGDHILLAQASPHTLPLVENLTLVLLRDSLDQPGMAAPARVEREESSPPDKTFTFTEISWGLLDLETNEELHLSPDQARAMLGPYREAAAQWTRLQGIPRQLAKVLTEAQFNQLGRPYAAKAPPWGGSPLEGAINSLRRSTPAGAR